MPSAITHYLCGQRVLNTLKENELIKVIDKDAFAWGCQGPDFLFCHRFLPWMHGESIASLGTQYHKADPNKILLAMVDYIKEANNLAISSYFLGFVCHYSLDSVAHPFVDYFAEKMEEDDEDIKKGNGHVIIESTLDTIFLRYEREALPSDIKLERNFPKNERVQNEIAKMYQVITPKILNIEVSFANLYQATKDSIAIFKLLNDKSGIKYNFFKKFGKTLKLDFYQHFRPITEEDDFDYANISKSVWLDYNGNEHSDDFFELVQKACKKALKIIYGIQSEDIQTLTNNESFGNPRNKEPKKTPVVEDPNPEPEEIELKEEPEKIEQKEE